MQAAELDEDLRRMSEVAMTPDKPGPKQYAPNTIKVLLSSVSLFVPQR
jgi:hypothetical protein